MKAKFYEGRGGFVTLMITPKTAEDYRLARAYQKQVLTGARCQVAVHTTQELTRNLSKAGVKP